MRGRFSSNRSASRRYSSTVSHSFRGACRRSRSQQPIAEPGHQPRPETPGEPMNAPIRVPGGTGTLGRLTVPLLREAGRQVRVLSRHGHEAEPGIEYVSCDLSNGEGIDAALAGVETILHLAGGPKGDDAATLN